ncbi:hypothetical protein R6Q59_012849 [Mikania micrantha]
MRRRRTAPAVKPNVLVIEGSETELSPTLSGKHKQREKGQRRRQRQLSLHRLTSLQLQPLEQRTSSLQRRQYLGFPSHGNLSTLSERHFASFHFKILT